MIKTQKFSLLIQIVKIIDISFINLLIYLSISISTNQLEYSFFNLSAVFSISYILVSIISKVYQSWRFSSIKKIIFNVLINWILVFFISFLFIFFFNLVYPLSRVLILLFLIFPIGYFVCSRFIGYKILKLLRNLGWNYKRVSIVGTGILAEKLASNIIKANWMGVEVVSFISNENSSEKKVLEKTIPIISSNDFKQNCNIDYLYLTSDNYSNILDYINNNAPNISIYKIIDTFSLDVLYSQWIRVGDVYGFSITETPFYGVSSIIKRLEDIILSSFILLVTTIPMIFISILIKVTSRGPIIFKQKRYGLHNQKIVVWKFRTMKYESKANFKQASKKDSRVTPLGKFLRKTSIDEFPQFFNVLQGRMSIVGPRPHPIPLDEEHKILIDKYVLRNKVKPGITGWAQVNGWRGETDKLYKMENRIRFDLEYIKNWSLLFDLKIVFLTIFKGFSGKNAY